MASVTDSIKLVFTENFAYLKIFCLSLIPYFIYKTETVYNSYGDTISSLLCFLLGLIYIGYLLWITANTVQSKKEILPVCNPFKAFAIGFKSLLALFPQLFLCLCFYKYFVKTANLSLMSDKVIVYIGAFLLLALLFTSAIFYAKKFSISDSWNLKNIFRNFAQIFIYLICTFVLLGLLCAVVAIPLLIFVNLLFGKHMIYNCTIIYLVTATLFVYFQNLGYAYFEYIKE